jgi:thiamine biosynthesis lipoprotein
METDSFRAMNTEIVLAAEGPSTRRLQEGFRRVRQFVADKEAQFTRFSEASELSGLNRSAGDWFQATPELFEVVRLARDLHEQTGGLFDPAVLPALRAAGYDRSMDQIRAFGAGPSVNFPGEASLERGLAGLMLDPASYHIKLPAGRQIDLGGVAKGWIAERATEVLAAYADACAVNAGGDMFLIGSPSDEPDHAWRIAVEDPLQPERDLAVLRVESGAVATSAVTRRRWMQGTQARHHIIDPRTLLPAETDWLSMTVIAPHAPTAEAFAKALLIAGSAQAARLADRYPQITFIGVRNDGALWGSSHSQEYLENANTNPELIPF